MEKIETIKGKSHEVRLLLPGIGRKESVMKYNSLSFGGVILFALLAVLIVPAHANFTFSNFSNIAELELVGDAAQSGNVLRLTPASDWQGGAAWFMTKQFIQDGFETTFMFRMTNLGGILDCESKTGADGIAFVLQNSSVTALGGLGGLIGYDGIANSLAVEFDTYCNNSELADPNGNHISIHTRGTAPNSAHEADSLGSTTSVPNISNGNSHTVKITYIPGSMKIFVDNLSTPVLVISVDLTTTLNLDGGHAWVGLTAATGGARENHDILNWSFREEIVVPPCFSTHNFGTGATLFNFCVTDHGNLLQLQSPAGAEHIQVGTDPAEGYIFCDGTAGATYHDTGSLESGWGAPTITQPNGPNTFPLTICRTTTDGNWTLCQSYARNTTEKEVTITMKVTNNTGIARTVQLSRYFDGAIDGTSAGDIYDRTTESVWGRQTHGLMLTTRSHATSHATFVETSPGTQTTCTPAGIATPTAAGDFVGTLMHNLGTIGARASKTVFVIYERD